MPFLQVQAEVDSPLDDRNGLLQAMAAAVTEVGYQAVTIRGLLERTGQPRSRFYAQFADKDDCFLAAYRAAADRLVATVGAAAREHGGVEPALATPSRPRLEAGLAALLSALAAEPSAGRLLLLEVHAAPPTALALHSELLAQLTTELLGPLNACSLAAEGVIGGIEAALRSQIKHGDAAELPHLLPELVGFAAAVLFGPNGAAPELNQV